MNRLFVGTSGWLYKHWGGSFYPKTVPASRQLAYYMEQFNTVEINATFYRLPTVKMVQRWTASAAPSFRYAVKGSRFITHMKKLKIEKRSINKFFSRVQALRRRLGPILWQLPPNLHLDLDRLAHFLERLPSGYRYAVEFRHPSWLVDGAFALLRRHRVAHVVVSSMAMPLTLRNTTDFVYMRFHGLEGGFAHDYTAEELGSLARHAREALRDGLKVYAYFNNDANTRAPQNAHEFVRLVLRNGRAFGAQGAVHKQYIRPPVQLPYCAK